MPIKICLLVVVFFFFLFLFKIAKHTKCLTVRGALPKGELLEHALLHALLTSSWILSLPADEDGTEITVMILYVILVWPGE